MMQELSLNVLDVAENSVRADASLVEITVEEDTAAGWLTIVIRDNGRGMTPEQVQTVIDPFYTTRTTRKVGLGVPFFRMAAQLSGGDRLRRHADPGANGHHRARLHALGGGVVQGFASLVIGRFHGVLLL